MSDVIIPRNFILLAELEAAEKGGGDYTGDCSIGIDHPRNSSTGEEEPDVYLKTWQGMILTHPDSRMKEQFINFSIYCDMNYPDKPPVFKVTNGMEYKKYFSIGSTIVVDSNGTINNKLPIFKSWTRNCRMIHVMKQIKRILEKEGI
jgi:ubiquitin-protein ligase